MHDDAEGGDNAGHQTVGEAGANDHSVEERMKTYAQEGDHSHGMAPVPLALLRTQLYLLMASVHHHVLL